MKGTVSCLLLAAAAGMANAAIQYASESGTVYHVSLKDKDGNELPVEVFSLNSTSQPSRRTKAPAKSQRRGTDTEAATYTGNWCGMVSYNPPSGSWKSVFGSWYVPQVALRPGQSAATGSSIAEWVGIDGAGCNSGLIQAGTTSQIGSDGSQNNYAWWEFIPDALHGISMQVNTGDLIHVQVDMTSPTSGVCAITNESSGQSLTIVIPQGPGTLCGQSAEWVLEDLSSNGLVPFATLPSGGTFLYYVGAYDTANNLVEPSAAEQFFMYQNGHTLCVSDYFGDTDQVGFLVSAEAYE